MESLVRFYGKFAAGCSMTNKMSLQKEKAERDARLFNV